MPTLEDRVDNLEHNYGTINRTFNMDVVPVLRKLDHAIMGYFDENSNKFVNGLVQTVENIANGKRTGRKRFWYIMGIAKDVVIGISVLFLMYVFGLKD